MNNKIKYLIRNMGWMTVSNFAAKILVFLLVPFYTRVLTTGEYGLYDMGYTLANLLAPLLTANIGEALMRFALTDKERTADSMSAAAFVSLVGIAISVLFAILICHLAPLTPEIKSCIALSTVLLDCSIVYYLFSQFARGIDRVKDMAIGALINTVLLVALSIIFIVPLDLGIAGCFFATSSSLLAAGVYIAIRCHFWLYITKPHKSRIKEMVSYGFPLGINTLAWWTNNAFGRYAVAFYCGIPSAGLLAAAYKIPSIPKVMQQIFVQAWQISSIKDFDSEDSDSFFAKTYDTMCVISSLLTSFVILILPALAALLFAADFYSAWVYVPLLMISVVFNCLASVVSGSFLAVGDSKPIALSAIASIIAAVAACVLFIPLIGIYGAAVSSALASIVMWATRMGMSRKYIRLRVNLTTSLFCFSVLLTQITLAFLMPVSAVWVIPHLICFTLLIVCAINKIGFKGLRDLTKKRRQG
jgi:O-antigen/teichoic acid export membrane protein